MDTISTIAGPSIKLLWPPVGGSLGGVLLLQSEGENMIWLHSFINRQYDRGSPIKILHKYPKEAYST